MDKGSSKFQLIPYIPFILAIATILVGVWQFSDKQAQANREPFLKAQLKLLFEASEVVATLATTTDQDLWMKKKNRFWVLYWGPLAVVEDQKVVTSMIKAGQIIPANSVQELPSLPLNKLQSVSITLSRAIRDLILKSWEIDMEPLSKLK